MDSRLALAATVAALVTTFAVAQTTPPVDDSPTSPPPLPPPPDIGPAVEAPPQIVKPKATESASDRPAIVAAPPPPTVLRSPVAVLQVLDKVTAETLRFEAPVGRRVRYKTLVVEVRACETRSYAEPEPRASAYLIIDTRSAPIAASQTPEDHEVFRGWSFAFTPALHAVEHPTYDLWLVACGGTTAAT